MNSILRWIDLQEWEFDAFLIRITLLMLLGIVFYSFLIFYLALSGLLAQVFLEAYLRELGIALSIGLLIGVLLAFVLLLPKYIKKEWDLHNVVPAFLLQWTIAVVVYSLIAAVLSYSGKISLTSFLTSGYGFGLGGFFAVLAYVAEIKKEHS